MLNPNFDIYSPMPHIWTAALRLNRDAPLPNNPNIQQADYYYHKQVVEYFINALRGAGVVIITKVDLVAVNGLTARADFMGSLPAFGGVVMTEIKTSLALDDYDDFPTLPRFQADVYRLVPMGGHVASPNAKVANLGLVPYTAFPAMRLDIIKAIPGQPFEFKTYPPGVAIPSGVL